MANREIKKEEIYQEKGYIAPNSTVTIVMKEYCGVYLLSIANNYSVGGLYCILTRAQTGSSAFITDLTQRNPSNPYFTIEGIG